MTTINTMEDLIRMLEARPEWRAAVRGLIVGEDLAQLPARVTALEQNLASFIQATDRNFQLVHQRLESLEQGLTRVENDVASLKEGQARVENDVASLKEGQARLEEGQARLAATQTRMSGQLANFTGSNFERKASRLAPRHIRRLFSLTRTRVLYSFADRDSPDFTALLDAAVDTGDITEDEADELRLTDLVLSGQDRHSQQTYVVVEVSYTAQERDAERSRERAAILERATGLHTLPLVIAVTNDQTNLHHTDVLGIPLLAIPED